MIDLEVEHPLLWRVRQLGVLPTDQGLRRTNECITPHLKARKLLLPIADVPRVASRALGLPDAVSELDAPRIEHALDAFERLDRDDTIGSAYAALLPVVPEPPERVRAIIRREVDVDGALRGLRLVQRGKTSRCYVAPGRRSSASKARRWLSGSSPSWGLQRRR